MPEPQDGIKSSEEKSSRILEFFNKTKLKDTKKEVILTKIVIRRLPPKLTKEGFLTQVQLPPNDYFYFVRGDLSLGLQSFSRAYVNILNSEDIYEFKEKYDDYPFVDELGREYHAVVEWSPVQRIPKKSAQLKVSNLGTLEEDPKYIEFLEKLEKERSNAGNASEYFMETESISSKEAKVTTTPLLEFIKQKHQQKIDLRNEHKLRKREAEKEKRRKEDEARRAEKKRGKERDKRKGESEESKGEDKEITYSRTSEETKNTNIELKDRKIDPKTPRPIKIEKPDFKSVRWEDKNIKREKISRDELSPKNVSENLSINKSRNEAIEERKNYKTNQYERKVFTNSKLGYSRSTDTKSLGLKLPDVRQKPSDDNDKTHEFPKKEQTKSKFRYSERNRDRDHKNQKSATKDEAEIKKELKAEKENLVQEKLDVSEKPSPSAGRVSRQSTQETSDGSADGDEVKSEEGKKVTSGRKDPRTERRIRNKDRPSIEIYRPGMGKFSKQRIEQKKDDSDYPQDKNHDKRNSDDKRSKVKEERKRDENKSEKTENEDAIASTTEYSKEREDEGSDSILTNQEEGVENNRSENGKGEEGMLDKHIQPVLEDAHDEESTQSENFKITDESSKQAIPLVSEDDHKVEINVEPGRISEEIVTEIIQFASISEQPNGKIAHTNIDLVSQPDAKKGHTEVEKVKRPKNIKNVDVEKQNLKIEQENIAKVTHEKETIIEEDLPVTKVLDEESKIEASFAADDKHPVNENIKEVYRELSEEVSKPEGNTNELKND